jgi:hypothetical protein
LNSTSIETSRSVQADILLGDCQAVIVRITVYASCLPLDHRATGTWTSPQAGIVVGKLQSLWQSTSPHHISAHTCGIIAWRVQQVPRAILQPCEVGDKKRRLSGHSISKGLCYPRHKDSYHSGFLVHNNALSLHSGISC